MDIQNGLAVSAATRTALNDRSDTGSGPSAVGDADQAAIFRPRVLVALALAIGFLLRLLQYASNRSLWLDEVLMVPGIVQRSFAELLRPSSWNHLPPGFLLLEKLAASAFGPTDLALRLVPFVAAIASLPLFAVVARRFVSERAWPFAIGLFSLSPFLVYYGSELKPYSTDVAVALCLLLLADRVHRSGASRKYVALFGAAAVVAAGLSLPSLFVASGIALALLVSALTRRDRRAALDLATMMTGWALVFGAPYLLFVHGTPANSYAREFWRSGFMPLPPTSASDLVWFPRTFFQLFRDPLGVFSDRNSASGVWGATAGLLAFVAGAVVMARTGRTRLWMLLTPVLVTLLASGLMLYPFGGSRAAGGRVLLFLVPVFYLVMAEGAAWTWERFRGASRIVPAVLTGLLFVPLLAWGGIAVPILRTEIKPLMEYLGDAAGPGDVVYVHYDIRRAFEHYADRYPIGQIRYVQGVCAREEPARYLDALTRLRGHDRVWVLFANGEGAGLFNEKALMVDYLEHAGTRLDDQVTVGASLYLFDLRVESGSTSPYRAELPSLPLGLADGCAFWD